MLADWAAEGGPGYVPDAGLWTMFPPVRLGLVRGGWLGPGGDVASAALSPEPAAGGMPRAWADSLSAGPQAAGWGGALDGALLRIAEVPDPAPGPRTRARFTLHGGDPDLEEAGLRVVHGDSLLRATLEMSSGHRAGFGPYDLSGRHRWQTTALTRYRSWTLEGRLGQRGFASRLASGEEEAVTRQWGGARIGTRRGAWRFAAQFTRAVDARESFAPFLLESRRDARETAAGVGGARAIAGGELALEAWWRGGAARRDVDPAFSSRADARVARASWDAPLGSARLILDAAVARPGSAFATYVVPAARVRVGGARLGGEAGIGRQIAPVWSDLAAGVTPFVQDVWAGHAAAHGAAGGLALGVDATLGRARGRVLAARLPLDELWLRLGLARDPRSYAFGLVSGSVVWNASRGSVGAEGFALARDDGASQALVDPGSGGRAFAEWRFALFKNDLGVALRADAAAVGARVPEESPARRLPGYVTSAVQASLTIGDASILIRASGLEGVRHPEPWRDLLSGEDALGPGRRIESLLSWTFFN